MNNKKTVFNYKNYREEKYKNWWNSWEWSYNEFAEYKANFINDFILKNNIKEIADVWCWDWNMIKKINLEKYIWYDISDEAVKLCKKQFNKDKSKSIRNYYVWKLMKNNNKFQATMSLDVLFHITKYEDFKETIKDLIESAEEFVILYARVKHQKGSCDWVSKFDLLKEIEWFDYEIYDNPLYPKTFSNFIIIKK